MGRYRVCKSFTVESGHMLSKHPESCRFPHGHSRRIEVVVSADELDANDMVVDFKALKLAVGPFIEHFDHRMAMNSRDPLAADVQRIHPNSCIIFENQDPTTEVLAEAIYRHVEQVLADGFKAENHSISPGRAKLERVRVWETDSSWAEFA